MNDPPFDNSAMDGFACRHDANATYPRTMDIVGIQAASGANENIEVMDGQAVRIMTGAPMPPGTDAILPVERCTVEGQHVVFTEAPKPHFVRRQGENLEAGAVALTKGMQLTPSRVGLCATMGHATVPVYRRLRVGIVSTGDKLKSPGEPLKHGEIYESNSFGLAGLVEWSGHEPVRYPAVADTMEALRATLNEASAACDLLLTSGGVSMGEFDYVRRIMEEEGDIHFWRMKIRPGSPHCSVCGTPHRCLAYLGTPFPATWCFGCWSPPTSVMLWGPTVRKSGLSGRNCAMQSSQPATA